MLLHKLKGMSDGKPLVQMEFVSGTQAHLLFAELKTLGPLRATGGLLILKTGPCLRGAPRPPPGLGSGCSYEHRFGLPGLQIVKPLLSVFDPYCIPGRLHVIFGNQFKEIFVNMRCILGAAFDIFNYRLIKPGFYIFGV